MGIIQKEKYFEYSSEQAIEAINRCSELYRECLKIEEKNFAVLHNENKINHKHSAQD